MADIHVCGLSTLVDVIQSSGAKHVISLINSSMEVPYPLSIPLSQRLFLGFNDIVEKVPGLEPPEKHHAEQVIDYVTNWNRKDPLVIHCWMGISRSTAGAYMTMCALRPKEDEYALAEELRRLSPSATPNIRLVQFADDILGRKGRMIDAIDEIGRGEDAFEGTPFKISV